MDVFCPELKLILIGDVEVGKTTFIHRVLTGDYQPRYIATDTVEVRPLKFWTNYGPCQFNVWDIPGERTDEISEYCVHSDCAIIMHDATNDVSYNNCSKWAKNKVEVEGAAPSSVGCINISVATSTFLELDNPFLQLLKQMSGKEIKFVTVPQFSEPQRLPLTQAEIIKRIQELQQTLPPLPDIDDSDDI